ncbi:helix-turn-helix domain-containing protein [Streptomyces sp. HUAS MG47]|uniref:AraC-like ligand-binding domain-containing protein n=1 Tax=Streptomyces solicamelliae TaxID=3231716 RepID=UPI0038780183
MIGTVFRTEDVPAEGRFDSWRDMIVQTRSADVASPHAADFRAEIRYLELGPVSVWHTSFAPSHFSRTIRRARGSDQERYHLTLLLDGAMTLDQDSEPTTVLGHRDLHLLDSAQPFEIRPYGQDCRVLSGVGVDFPMELLPLPPDRVRALRGRGLSAREGMGALLADFLVGLGRQADTLRPADAPRLGATVLDLVSGWLAGALDAEAELPPETRHELLAEGVRAFVHQNLRDPDLTPSSIAAAHHVSLSHLHRVFTGQSGGETLAAWIRGRRLEQARRDLADPALGTTPIHAVAARWGFPRASDFTRAFRGAYGMSPREHRQQAETRRRENAAPELDPR